MAPIKLEDNIREKLEGREIEPSSDAWIKLRERIDDDSKKKNNYAIWYAIAATIIGVFIAVTVFSNRGDKLNENPTDFVDVHTSERDEPTENVPNLVENVSEEKNKAIVVAEESNSVKINMEKDSDEAKLLPKKKEIVLKNTERKVSQYIAKTTLENQAGKMSRIPEEIIINDELIMDKRINELAGQVALIKQKNEAVLAEEVNTLLTNAERRIQTNRILNSKKIAPEALLVDVELEKENTFSEKVFKSIGDGYDFVKTAVVDRNN